MSKPDYVITLERWQENGTLALLGRLIEEKTEVNIPRSNGSTSRGTITGWDHAGLSVSARFVDGDGVTKYKADLSTAKVIEKNPGVFVAEHEYMRAK